MTRGIEITDEEIEKIRIELPTKSKRQLAKEMGLDVWTVRKYARLVEEEEFSE